MMINVREQLTKTIQECYGDDAEAILAYLPDQPFQPERVKAILINEIVADRPGNDFYSRESDPAYMETTIPLFRMAGADVSTIDDIIALGVYITNMVKMPKTHTTIEKETIARYVPLLAQELALFPNIKAIMLMGDVAKKAYNMITKAESGKNAVPSGSTYKLRESETYYQGIRIFPAYIMTGKNILIEKSKVEMSAKDIAKMLALI